MGWFDEQPKKNEQTNGEQQTEEMIGFFSIFLLCVVIVLLTAGSFVIGLLCLGVFQLLKDKKMVNLFSIIAGLLLAAVLYFEGWRVLFQLTEATFTLVGMERFVNPVENLINNGSPFQMTWKAWLASLSLGVLFARAGVAVIDFYRGKVVTSKDDKRYKYRQSKQFKAIKKHSLSITNQVQANWRKRKAKQLEKNQPIEDILLGIDENRNEITMKSAETKQHVLVAGTTGSGKTVAIMTLIETALMNHESVVFVDGKGDSETIEDLQSMFDRYGRTLHVFSENTDLTYNPLKNGNRSEITDRLMALFDWSNEFYENEAQDNLQKVVYFLDLYEIDRDLKNLLHFLSVKNLYSVLKNDIVQEKRIVEEQEKVEKSPSTVENQQFKLKVTVPTDSLDVFGDAPSSKKSEEVEYRTVQKEIIVRHQSERSKKMMVLFFDKETLSDEEDKDIEKAFPHMRQNLQGLRSQLSQLVNSELGRLLEEKESGLDLVEVMKRGEGVIFSFNSLSYEKFIKRMGRFVIADTANAVKEQFKTNKSDRKGVTAVFDEFSAYGSEKVADITARARSANMRAVIGIQSFADLADVSGVNIKEKVIDTCNTIWIGKQNSSTTADEAASIGGTFSDQEVTYQLEDKGGLFKRIDLKTEKGTVRNVQAFYFHPNEIKSFDTGQFAVIRKAARGLSEEERRRVIFFRNPLIDEAPPLWKRLFIKFRTG
ncbi:type IV secretory system conjugative DNA transfer family protein [Bacillus sp. V2I10]|uniref:type IV secretory system conjugative DNA transfer family protein n=1 Tax=Bacillus sp. V2I10 TaxID=3042276 RepID=UPI002781CA02|nr:type IV secretion system DNA-binding domain-containing protein [Bacillus sp. V2I10]MDQ0862373.1 conjugal transfer pilus assembly protein TraD [Bacillus sp. V2I10]